MCAKLGVNKYREVRRRGRVEYTVYKRGNIVNSRSAVEGLKSQK